MQPRACSGSSARCAQSRRRSISEAVRLPRRPRTRGVERRIHLHARRCRATRGSPRMSPVAPAAVAGSGAPARVELLARADALVGPGVAAGSRAGELRRTPPPCPRAASAPGRASPRGVVPIESRDRRPRPSPASPRGATRSPACPAERLSDRRIARVRARPREDRGRLARRLRRSSHSRARSQAACSPFGSLRIERRPPARTRSPSRRSAPSARATRASPSASRARASASRSVRARRLRVCRNRLVVTLHAREERRAGLGAGERRRSPSGGARRASRS